MKVVFLLPGTEGRPKTINGDTIRYQGASSSGTDQSVILVAEHLAACGWDITIVLDKTDKVSCRNVKYTDFTYEGLHEQEIDVLVSTLWFTKYNELPFTVSKGLIYWFHMAWVYGISEIIEYCKKQKLQLGFVNPSKWSQEQNSCWIELAKKEFISIADIVIPNPVMTELLNEIKEKENIIKKPKSSIFHAQYGRGGEVADKAIEKLNWEKSYKFDYTNHENGVDKQTVFKKLLESDYFVFPLYHPNGCVYKDTFSCSVAEAIAAGVIVVTYPLGAFPEYFSLGCSFLEFPAETDLKKMLHEKVTCEAEYMNVYQNIVERLTYLEANPQLKEEIRNQSKNLIQNNFSVKQLGHKWNTLLNSFNKSYCDVKEYVGGAFYINLNSRSDRKEQFEEELKKIKLVGVERVEAIELSKEQSEEITNNGGWTHPPIYEKSMQEHLGNLLRFQRSCVESHKKAIKLAQENDWENVLIFEDDCVFMSEDIQQVLNDIQNFIKENKQWDLIFLGISLLHVPEKYNEKFYKLAGRFFTTHAYLINKKFYSTVLDYDHKTGCNIDVLYTELANEKNFFCYHRLLANQRTSHSDIERRVMSLEGRFINNFYFFTKKYKDHLDFSKIGFFYQTSKNSCAVHMNLKQLDTYYPNSPKIVWEDITQDCKNICNNFNVSYKRVYRLPDSTEWVESKPITEINGGLQYLYRLYSSCVNELSSAEWIMHYEDDVWCSGYIKNFPTTFWGGGHSTTLRAYNQELIQYMKEEMGIKGSLHGGACGGTLISRQAIIESFHKLHSIDWSRVLALDPNMAAYSDNLINFMLLVGGYEWSSWDDWEQGGYEEYKVYTKPFIHNIKYWYHRPYFDLEKINEKDNVKFFLNNNNFFNVC